MQINPHVKENIVKNGTIFNKNKIINLNDQQVIIVSEKQYIVE